MLCDLPRALIAVPTFRCPLRCTHCDLWQLPDEEIEPDLWRRRIEELADEVELPLLVGISGGEPLVYAGINELVGACHEAGFLTALATSTLPLNDRRTRRLLAAGLSALVVSLDGMGLSHDLIRKKPGLFEHALGVVDRVKEYSPQLNLTVVATVTRALVGELVSMVQWVDGLPHMDALCFHTLSANLGGPEEHNPRWHRANPLWPGGAPGLQQEVERLAQMSAGRYPLVNSPAELRAMGRFYAAPDEQLRPCDQHDIGMIALPDGGIKICPLQDPVGSIRTHSLVEIWRSEAAVELRQAMKSCQRNCHFLTNFAYQRHLVQ